MVQHAKDKCQDWVAICNIMELYMKCYSSGRVFNASCSLCGIEKPADYCAHMDGCIFSLKLTISLLCSYIFLSVGLSIANYVSIYQFVLCWYVCGSRLV